MSNFSYPDTNTLTGIWQYMNTVTDPLGMYSIMFVLVYFLINYAGLSKLGLKNSVLPSLFSTLVMSLLMVATGLLTGMYISFLLTIILVLALIWSYYV